MLATSPQLDMAPTSIEEGIQAPRGGCGASTSAANGLLAFALSNERVVILDRSMLHPSVEQLARGDFSSNDTEEIMASLRRAMIAGDLKIAGQLAALVMVHDDGDPSLLDAQCLAIEILAAARMPQLSRQIHAVIRKALTSTNVDLQFAAIAALSDLSRLQRELYKPLVRFLVDQPDRSGNASVKSAARAFLGK